MSEHKFFADLHLHSRFSRATSKKLDLALLAAWAGIKGIQLLGTGDFTHPLWRKELNEQLLFDENTGFYALKNPKSPQAALPSWQNSSLLQDKAPKVQFMLQTEISSIYKRGGKVRKVHNLVYLPNLEVAENFSQKLAQIGNLNSDGRPILGLDSENLLDLVLNMHPEAFLVPAHIWTPWFSIFGSKSGFDSVEECFGSLAEHIFALETGLSSDPQMNRRLSMLDKYRLISNSDAHSGENLAREANVFKGKMTYSGVYKALKAELTETKVLETKFLGTLEFFPEEGKYHLDGHRACQQCFTPEESLKHNTICPVCNKHLTLGTLFRIEQLADRKEAKYRADEEFKSLIPLPEILSEVLAVGSKSLKVREFYQNLLSSLGSELEVLQEIPLASIASFSEPLAEGIQRMRAGKVFRQGGYDGEFGKIFVFTAAEQQALKSKQNLNFNHSKVHSLNLLAEASAEKQVTDSSAVGNKFKPTEAASSIASVSNEPKQSSLGSQARAEQLEVFSDPLQEKATAISSVTGVPDANDAEAAPNFQASTESSDYVLQGLNPEQLIACNLLDKAVLCLAGPGTGKTHSLIARLEKILSTGVSAKQILALTYTRRAAKELDERLQRLYATDAELGGLCTDGSILPRTDTLHALAFEVWHRTNKEIPVLLTKDTAWQVFNESNFKATRQECKTAWGAINLSREQLKPLAEEYLPFVERYNQHKIAWNLADYIDLLELWLSQCQSGAYKSTWKHILVDEIQDLSPLQLALVIALTPTAGVGFFGIGDKKQSIYSFRGAHGEVETLLKSTWADLQVIKLSENYRSAANIVNCYEHIFKDEENFTALRAIKKTTGEIHIFGASSAESEATWLTGHIRKILGSTSHQLFNDKIENKISYRPSDIAILMRSRELMQPVRRALERAGIPFSQPSQDPFWNDPLVIKILEVVGSMLGISPTVQSENKKSLPECPEKVLLRGPLTMSAYWGTSEPFESRFWKSEAFKELVKAFEEHSNWLGLFNWLSLQNEMEMLKRKSESVQLLTLHAAKGLEFKAIFMPALEDGLLPFAGSGILSGQGTNKNDKHNEILNFEEEKRLFYVGLSRAVEKLFLSFSAKRFIYGKEIRLPSSRFLKLIPEENTSHKIMVAKHKSTQEHLKLF